MSDAVRWSSPGAPQRRTERSPQQSGTDLADILERVLDKGIVIAGDIQVNLLDIELLTIKIRLVVASVDRAKEMGIDWWERDPTLSGGRGELEEENAQLRERLARLERLLPGDEPSASPDAAREAARDDPAGAPGRADPDAVERSIDEAVEGMDDDPDDEHDDDAPDEHEPDENAPDDGPRAGRDDGPEEQADGDRAEDGGAQAESDTPRRRSRPAAPRRRRSTTTRRPARGKD